MKTETKTIQQLASDASKCFEVKTRPGLRSNATRGTDAHNNGEEFTCLKDNAPQWLKDLVHEAHGDMLPDDWKYSKIESMLDAISLYDDPQDASGEIIDGLIDIYNSDRSAWLASNLMRAEYVDEAQQEFGEARELWNTLAAGQYMELGEMFGSIMSSLETQLEA